MLRVATLAIAVCCVPALTRIVLTLPLHTPLNYNEGWNAYRAMDVVQGRPLYPRAPSLFSNNYPPVSFFVLATAVRVGGDAVVAGRCVALIAFAVWTLLLARTAVRLGCRPGEAWFGAALFAALMLRFSDYVGVDDPQMLGHAIATAGLLLLLREPRTLGRIAAAALLLAAGVFVKQSLIALPLSAAAWLLWHDPPAGRRLLAIGGAAAVGGVALWAAAFGSAAVLHAVAPRAYVPYKAVSMSLQWIVRSIVFIATLAVVGRAAPRDAGVRFCVLYASMAGIIGCLLAGGEGINWNVLFDGTWALCLGASVTLNRWPLAFPHRAHRQDRTTLVAAYLLIPTIALTFAARAEWLAPGYWLNPRAAEAAATRDDIAFLGSHGPALCEDLALCFWADQPAVADFFGAQQSMRRGGRDVESLTRLVELGHFGVVETEEPTRDLGHAFETALRRAYRLDHAEASHRYWVPR